MNKENYSFFAFEIIAGDLKGRIIKTPDLGITRPPLSRIRRAIFDFLTPYLESARYLDLFSGTGSYLFEAVSRYAAYVLGVEQNEELTTAVNRQAELFKVSDRLFCRCQDVFEAIPELAGQKETFDIIMVAPPQYRGFIDRTLLALKENHILDDDGIILCQHDTSETKKINFTGFNMWQQRKYGNTTFTVLKQ